MHGQSLRHRLFMLFGRTRTEPTVIEPGRETYKMRQKHTRPEGFSNTASFCLTDMSLDYWWLHYQFPEPTVPILGRYAIDQESVLGAPQPASDEPQSAFATISRWLRSMFREEKRLRYSPKVRPVVEKRKAWSREAAFGALSYFPDEVLINIMEHMGVPGLYLMRQTSSGFARMFHCREFVEYHSRDWWPQTGRAFVPFRHNMHPEEEEVIAASLQRDLFCDSCLETRRGAVGRQHLAYLFEKIFCDGCKEDHPRFLFAPASIENKMRRGAGVHLVCIGRQSWISLCRHKGGPNTGTWTEIVEKGRDFGLDLWACKHPSHLYRLPKCEDDSDYVKISGCPRFTFHNEQDGGVLRPYKLAYGWDLPLVDIDQICLPTADEVREFLSRLVRGGFAGYNVCSHFARDEHRHLRAFVETGICNCFTQPQCHIHPFSSNSARSCQCGRSETYVECRDCGAFYSWHVSSGRITLVYRYTWAFWKPTSPPWLALIDEESYREDIFVEETKHVLWCDNSRCAGRHKRRWFYLAKIYMASNLDTQLGQYEWQDIHFAEERYRDYGYRRPLLP